jgi:dextranase
MNSVNQFGQENSISTASVDFTYAELWTGNEGYKELAASIQNNYKYSNGKSSVIAAYLNYNKAENPGTFNTAGVLMANAVIFAFGGSHIELGEHMLAKEYFPNHNLSMNDDLKKAIIAYYDFLTAYENLLRDGGIFNTLPVNCINGKMNVSAWPPESGKVVVMAKQVGSKQVLHFINFANASSFDWRDTNGTLPVPNTIAAADMEVHYSGTAKKIWVASPDNNFGIPIQLNFTQTGSTLKFTLPQLKYWDMLVIE